MLAEFRPALVLLGAFTLLTGVAYPAVVTVGARVALPTAGGGQPDSRGRPRSVVPRSSASRSPVPATSGDVRRRRCRHTTPRRHPDRTSARPIRPWPRRWLSAWRRSALSIQRILRRCRWISSPHRAADSIRTSRRRRPRTRWRVWRARAASPGRGSRARRCAYRGPHVRPAGRAAGQRAATQPCAGQPVAARAPDLVESAGHYPPVND